MLAKLTETGEYLYGLSTIGYLLITLSLGLSNASLRASRSILTLNFSKNQHPIDSVQHNYLLL